jgi:hypothetical protein
LDLASRYISPNEAIDFPFEGDLFCLLSHSISQDQPASRRKVGYLTDMESVSVTPSMKKQNPGKMALDAFCQSGCIPSGNPGVKTSTSHVVKGYFQSADRSHEIRIIKISTGNVLDALEKKLEHPKKEEASQQVPDDNKIVKFRRKGVTR